ncbi:MAG TPA: CBS domain-containing protein [candidate division Zixibacteria bacterium]|nr:CBS domain-containing protein [candidate division Zixibacteria bacterium]
MKVSDILATKGRKVVSIETANTLKEAMDSIVTNKIGALLVLKEKELVGIISERDLIRELHKTGESALGKKVGEVMTTNIVVGLPDDDIEEVEALMTKNRFRHLPIFDKGKVAGIVSIGDIVKLLAADRKTENRYLKDYITGKYPG